MLSDDEIWSRWKFPTDLSWKQSVIALARAIEREARQQALEDAALAAAPQPPSAKDDAVEALRRIIEAANGRQHHNPITDEMNAAQGGDR